MANKPPLDRVFYKILHSKKFSADACALAIRGEQVPPALGSPVTRLSVIRGIRYHANFAKELYGRAGEFSRALNARSIMSNVVPDMTRRHEFPYCIWHPNTASETTYRELVRRYPQMAYQVGRACAVAGYTNLYLELGLLPEVHIAEEARDNGSIAIFDSIMASGLKYIVMDDYARKIDTEHPRAGASLNGDTAVRSLLDIKHKYVEPSMVRHSSLDPGYPGNYFNITEDMGIDEYDSELRLPREDVTPLLYSPLPVDLPTVDKDLLILMAAYYGDIDRYIRLRRPIMVRGEINSVVRGIYHSTMFAKWWSLQPGIEQKYKYQLIKSAINARFIMNNDLSRIVDNMSANELPYYIWYPARATPEVYIELARRKPIMKPQIARALMILDCQDAYDKVDVEADPALLDEARVSQNPHYLSDLERKHAENPNTTGFKYTDDWKSTTYESLFEKSTTLLPKIVTAANVRTDADGIFEGLSVDVSSIELYVCAPPALNQDDFTDLELVYRSSQAESIQV